MPEAIKLSIIPVIDLFADSGFFYEYGIIKSLIAIASYFTVALFLARNFIFKVSRNIKILPELWIGLIGLCFAYLYLRNINIEDYAYFYPPTTLHRIENIFVLSVIYGLTMAEYYSFYNAVFGEAKRKLVYICMAAIITSPLQLWVLFSSSTRDFLRAPILTLFFILIVYTIRKKIIFTNRIIFFCSALMVGAMTFRQDILLYFPIFIMAIIVFNNEVLKIRLFNIFKMILYFIPGYIFLTSGLFNSFERASGRFIPGLSEDVVRTYYGEPTSYIGPFNDLIASVVVNTNATQSVESDFAPSVYEKIDFFIEYCSRLPTILLDTYELPLTSNFYPAFFGTTWEGQFLSHLRIIFSENYFFGIVFVFMTLGLWSYKKLFIFLHFTVIYLSLFNGLQFLTKNIFHLEIFSYLILVSGCYFAIDYSKNILKSEFLGKR